MCPSLWLLGAHPMEHGKFLGSFHLAAPLATNRCGTLLTFVYFGSRCLSASRDYRRSAALHRLQRACAPARRFRRAVGVVIGNEPDLSSVDATVSIYLVEIGRDRLADDTVSRRRAAVGHDVANSDLRIGGTRIAALLGRGRNPSRWLRPRQPLKADARLVASVPPRHASHRTRPRNKREAGRTKFAVKAF